MEAGSRPGRQRWWPGRRTEARGIGGEASAEGGAPGDGGALQITAEALPGLAAFSGIPDLVHGAVIGAVISAFLGGRRANAGHRPQLRRQRQHDLQPLFSCVGDESPQRP